MSASRSNPAVVYAMIEAQEDGVLWRSNDHGKTWRVTTNNHGINNRPFYYTEVRVDPNDENRIYARPLCQGVNLDASHTRRLTGWARASRRTRDTMMPFAPRSNVLDQQRITNRSFV